VTDQLTGAAQYRAVLGNTELVALLSARVLSGIGDQLARVVLALYVLDRSNGNALLAALVLAVSYLPSTFGFALLGSLADRFPRRAVMLWADLIRALLVTALAVAVARDAGVAAVLLLLVAETFSAPALSARSSLLPDAARSPVEYQAVVGLGNTFEQVIQVVGFIVAGVALGITSATWVLLFNALTFLISYLIILAFVMPRPTAAASGTSAARMFRDMKSGLRTIVRSRSLRAVVLLLWASAALLVATDAVALPYATQAGAPPWAATVLLAATPAGAAIGSCSSLDCRCGARCSSSSRWPSLRPSRCWQRLWSLPSRSPRCCGR
jgi:MFS family permease